MQQLVNRILTNRGRSDSPLQERVNRWSRTLSGRWVRRATGEVRKQSGNPLFVSTPVKQTLESEPCQLICFQCGSHYEFFHRFIEVCGVCCLGGAVHAGLQCSNRSCNHVLCVQPLSSDSSDSCYGMFFNEYDRIVERMLDNGEPIARQSEAITVKWLRAMCMDMLKRPAQFVRNVNRMLDLPPISDDYDGDEDQFEVSAHIAPNNITSKLVARISYVLCRRLVRMLSFFYKSIQEPAKGLLLELLMGGVQSWGNMSYMIAGYHGHVELLSLLTGQTGIDPESIDNYALARACQLGHADAVAIILKSVTNIPNRLRIKDSKVAKALLADERIRAKILDKSFFTPALFAGVMNDDNLEVFKELIELSEENPRYLLISASFGTTPALQILAWILSRSEVTATAITYGLDQRIMDPAAADMILKRLFELVDDPNSVASNIQEMLMRQISRNTIPCVVLLLDQYQEYLDLETAIDSAVTLGRVEILRMIFNTEVDFSSLVDQTQLIESSCKFDKQSAPISIALVQLLLTQPWFDPKTAATRAIQYSQTKKVIELLYPHVFSSTVYNEQYVESLHYLETLHRQESRTIGVWCLNQVGGTDRYIPDDLVNLVDEWCKVDVGYTITS